MKMFIAMLATALATLLVSDLVSSEEPQELRSLKRSVGTLSVGDAAEGVQIYRDTLEGHDVWVGATETGFALAHHPECSHPIHRD